MSKLMSTIYKSLLRATSDLIKEVQDTTSVGDVEYRAWETREDEDSLPAKTLIGVDGWHFDENNGLWLVRFGLTISVYNDFNLMNEADILDIVHERFGFQKKVSLRDVETGDIFSEMYVSGFQVMPMAQSQMRNYRTVGVELMRTDSSEV